MNLSTSIVLWLSLCVHSTDSEHTMMTFVADTNNIEVYIDGTLNASAVDEAKVHMYSNLERNTQVIGIALTYTASGVLGFIMSTDSGFYTDESWKCEHESNLGVTLEVFDLMQPEYDDSSWPQAVLSPHNGSDPSTMEIDQNAKWIRGSDSTASKLFCRAKYRDPCWKQAPCLNGATCTNVNNGFGYSCECTDKFRGVHCEIDKMDMDDECLSSPCQNGGVCIDYVNFFSDRDYGCQCPMGYIGDNCEILQETDQRKNFLVKDLMPNSTDQFKVNNNSSELESLLGETNTKTLLSLSISNITAYSMLLIWENSQMDERFIVSYRLYSISKWNVYSNIFNRDDWNHSQLIINDLMPDSPYEVQVEGNTSLSEILLVRTRLLPSPPEQLSVIAYNTHVEVSWNESDDYFDHAAVRCCAETIGCRIEDVPKGTNKKRLEFANVSQDINYTLVVQLYQEDLVVVTSDEFHFNPVYGKLIRDNVKTWNWKNGAQTASIVIGSVFLLAATIVAVLAACKKFKRSKKRDEQNLIKIQNMDEVDDMSIFSINFSAPTLYTESNSNNNMKRNSSISKVSNNSSNPVPQAKSNSVSKLKRISSSSSSGGSDSNSLGSSASSNHSIASNL